MSSDSDSQMRESLLERFYEETNNPTTTWIDPAPIGVRIGIDFVPKLSVLIDHLVRAGLVETSDDNEIRLTGAGVAEVVRVRSRATRAEESHEQFKVPAPSNDRDAPSLSDTDAVGGSEPKLGWRAAVIGVGAAVEATVLALLGLYPPVSIWAVLLLTLGVLLFVAILLSKLTKANWFPQAAAWTLVAVLTLGGVAIRVTQTRPQLLALPTPEQRPVLAFVQTSPITVPWCNYFYLTVTGIIPTGYRILVFDASADANYNVTSYYSYDGVAQAVPRVLGEWVAGPIYIGSRFELNDQGQPVLRNGQPVSNAGYLVAVFAVLVPIADMQLLDDVNAATWDLKQMPSNATATAKLDVIRNGNTRQCVRPVSLTVQAAYLQGLKRPGSATAAGRG